MAAKKFLELLGLTTTQKKSQIDLKVVYDERDSTIDHLTSRVSELETCNSYQKKLIKLLESENYRLKDGLSTIQANLADSVSHNNSTLKDLGEVASSFNIIKSESEVILMEITNLNHNIQKTTASSQEIDQGAKDIMDTLKGLAEIAFQTKLLSFNASVEAARAGEAGKGFAVVAEEVQNLANATSKLLERIKQKTQNFEEISYSLQTSVNDSLKRSNVINEKIVSFDNKITTTIDNNDNSVNKVSATNDEIFMSLAKLDHVIWKVNTYISVLEQKPAFNFVDHFNCRLGKWYYEGNGKQSFSCVNSYKDLEAHHAKVHNGTKKMFDFLEDVQANIEKIIDGANEMENASERVFKGLDNILTDKKNLPKR